jgi:hypothetical protein
MRNLVKRYVAAMIREAKTEEGLTEENVKVKLRLHRGDSVWRQPLRPDLQT